MNPVDPEKVTAFLAGWNAGRPADNPLWKEVEGTSALIKMEVPENGPVVFHPNEGFPIKAFLNTETGEVRTFNARRFSRS